MVLDDIDVFGSIVVDWILTEKDSRVIVIVDGGPGLLSKPEIV
jgi:hypothetical protein